MKKIILLCSTLLIISSLVAMEKDNDDYSGDFYDNARFATKKDDVDMFINKGLEVNSKIIDKLSISEEKKSQIKEMQKKVADRIQEKVAQEDPNWPLALIEDYQSKRPLGFVSFERLDDTKTVMVPLLSMFFIFNQDPDVAYLVFGSSKTKFNNKHKEYWQDKNKRNDYSIIVPLAEDAAADDSLFRKIIGNQHKECAATEVNPNHFLNQEQFKDLKIKYFRYRLKDYLIGSVRAPSSTVKIIK